jgi:hypothetical protein
MLQIGIVIDQQKLHDAYGDESRNQQHYLYMSLDKDNPAIDLKTLKRVIEQGKHCYAEDISFPRWYEKMIMENGTCVRPHLRDAWKHITQGSFPDEEPVAGARLGKEGRIRQLIARQDPKRKAFALGAACAFVLGAVTFILVGSVLGIGSSRQSRFILVRGGGNSVYKMDTRTGQIWCVQVDRAYPVNSPAQR